MRAVLTAEDIPGNKFFGRIKADNPILCSDRVRFLGDAVALVFAENAAAARQAADLIDVEYEELPGVFSISESMTEGAPALHEEETSASISFHEIGDVDEARKKCAHIVSGHFETAAVDPGTWSRMQGSGFLRMGSSRFICPPSRPFTPVSRSPRA